MAFKLSVPGRAVLRRADALRFVISGLTWAAPDEARLERALIHLQLSIDAPRPDATHLDVELAGRKLTLREALALLPRGRAATRVERLEQAQTGEFDFETTEAFERVVRHYRIDWSNFMPYAPTVRARFVTDTREGQEWFLHEFLELYDANTDVTAEPGAAAAAQWLRARRRYTCRHTLFLTEQPRSLAPLDTLERAVREAFGALQDEASKLARPGPLAWVPLALADLSATPKTEGLGEVLDELGVPPPTRAFQLFVAACHDWLRWTSIEHVEVPEALRARWNVLRAAVDEAFQTGW